ncbi:MAG: thioredoxin [Bacillota bacterium]|jgi:thioredoxin 1|nr:MAG: thioredoxin [Bacillota bacterium]
MDKSGNLLTVSDADFDSEVLKREQPVLVDFWAPWCGPCRMIAPVVESIADDYEGKMAVAKLNVDENPATAQRYQVMGIPTLILFRDGKPVERFVGYMPKEDLQRRVDAAL